MAQTTAPVNNAQPAAIHQVGIVRSGVPICGGHLSLPGFVHRQGWFMADAWLDFSALYIIPPQMTTLHQTYRVRQGANGTVQAWYPYAAGTSRTLVEWRGVQTGVMADGPETTHPVWMQARAVESAATVKVHKDDAGRLANIGYDDPGTTEGDVYLFMRSTLDRTSVPLRAKYDQARREFVITPQKDLPATADTVHAWLVQAKSEEEVLAQRFQLAAADGEILLTRTSAEFGALATLSALELRTQLNEALAGNGLKPDEAAVLSGLALKSVETIRTPVLVYLVPQQWTDANFPLSIDGPAEKPLRVFLGIEVPPPVPPGRRKPGAVTIIPVSEALRHL